MSDLLPEERELAKRLLRSGRVERPSMQRALGRVKSQRLRGQSVELQEILIRKGLVSENEIEEILGAGEQGGPPGGREAGGFVLDSDSGSGAGDGETQAIAVGGFVLDGADAEPEDGMTRTLDTKEAALAALAFVNNQPTKLTLSRSPLAPLAWAAGLLLCLAVGIYFGLGGSEPVGPIGPKKPAESEDLSHFGATGGARFEPLEELRERAEGAERDEKYEAAIEAWQELRERREVSKELIELAGRSIERLAKLKAYKQEVDSSLGQISVLRAAGKDAAVVSTLSSLAERNKELSGSATADRVEAALLAAFDAANREAASPGTQRPSSFRDGKKKPSGKPTRVTRKPKPVKKPEARMVTMSQSRARWFIQRRNAAEKRVHGLRMLLSKQKSERRRRLKVEGERVAKLTRRRPLSVKLPNGMELKGVRVSRYDEKGFTLSWKGGQLSYRWEIAEAWLGYEIRRLAAGNDPRALMGLGRFCLKRRLFAKARRAYERAGKLLPALRRDIPNIDALESETRVFRGRFSQLGGGRVELSHDFKLPSQIKDFASEARLSLRQGRLEIAGDKVFMAGLRNLIFRDSVHASIAPGPTSRRALVAVGLVRAARGQGRQGYLLAFQPVTRAIVILAWTPEGTKTLETPRRLVRTPRSMAIELEDGGLRFFVNGERVGQLNWPYGSDGARVVVGGASHAEDTVSIRGLTVRGEVGRRWLRKTFGAAESRLRAMLAASEELPALARPRKARPLAKLSAEDPEGLKGLSAAQLEQYQEAIRRTDSESVRRFLSGLGALQKIVKKRPNFAAAHFHRGQGLRRLGRKPQALEAFEIAIQSIAGFHEAMAQRALLLVDLGRWKEARALAEKALAIAPAEAAAYAARGRCRFHDSDLSGALSDLEIALALDPWSDEVRSLHGNLVHVIAGPSWDRRFVEETEHYRVETDISATKAEFYASQLETIHEFYRVRLGLSEADIATAKGNGRKALVLIFDSREGFHSYAKLTTDDRVESFLGYFHPRYRQLLLFEDRRDRESRETLRVLYHEGFHQFTHEIYPRMPYWLSEGMAEYYAACEQRDGQVLGEGRLHRGRVQDLKSYLRSHPPIDFEKLMLQTPGEFYSGPVAVKYAQAWAMVHFFLHGAKGVYRKPLGAMLKLLRAGNNQQQSYAASFGKLDLQKAARAWRRYVDAWK